MFQNHLSLNINITRTTDIGAHWTEIYSDFFVAGLSTTERAVWSVDMQQLFHPLYGEQSSDKTLLSVLFTFPSQGSGALVASLSKRRPEFDPGLSTVSFVVQAVTGDRLFYKHFGFLLSV
jgi:hypothetical protein